MCRSSSNGRELEELADALATLPGLADEGFLPDVDAEAANGLEFSDCLRRALAEQTLRSRCGDPTAVRAIHTKPPRRIVTAE